jgi:hypothetical protein
MRRLLLLLVLLPTVAAQSAEPSLSCISAIAEGRFGFDLRQASHVVFRGPHEWNFGANQIILTIVDDHDDNAVENPAAPGKYLIATANQTVTTRTLDNVAINWKRSQENSIAILEPVTGTLGLQGIANLTNAPTTQLEASHFVSVSAVGLPNYYYEVIAPAGVRVAANGQINYSLLGNEKAYAWGDTLTLTTASETTVIKTGQYQDAPLERGSFHSNHDVHAFIELRGLSGSIQAHSAEVYTPELAVISAGSLSMMDASGTMPTQNGLGQVYGGITATGGHFSFTASPFGLQAAIVETPSLVVGSILVAHHSSTPLVLGLLLAAAVCLSAAWPSIKGRRLNPQSRGRAARAEAWASWAAEADSNGHNVRGALAAWRAVRNQPKDPGRRLEFGVLLRQSGRARMALAQHEEARRLLALQSDPGIGALNDFNAAIAAAALGLDDQAIDWLRGAVEKDVGLAEPAAVLPEFRRVRLHPDYEAVVGRAP